AEVRAWQLDGSTPGDVQFDDADPQGSAELAEIDAQLDVVSGETEAERRVVRLPGTLSATQLRALAEDEPAFARSLARPKSRRPVSAPGSTRGLNRITAHRNCLSRSTCPGVLSWISVMMPSWLTSPRNLLPVHSGNAIRSPSKPRFRLPWPGSR